MGCYGERRLEVVVVPGEGATVGGGWDARRERLRVNWQVPTAR